jgi:ribonuclease Z
MIEITFLGTSCGIPTKERSQSSISLRYEGDYFLFDCGEGTQRQLKFAKISPMRIKAIFLSHLHGDHMYGIPPLLDSLSFFKRKDDLTIFGPVDTERVIESLQRMGYAAKPAFKIKVKECKEGKILDNERYEIHCFPTRHSTPSLGFVFQEKDKPGRFDREKALKLEIPESRMWSKLQQGQTVKHKGKTFTPDMVLGPPRKGKKIVITGDTMPSDKTVANSEGADILIHEGTFSDSIKEKSRKFKHSTVKEAAEIAKKAGVKKLILTHLSQRYDEEKDVKELLKEAKDIFTETEIADDFSRFTLR